MKILLITSSFPSISKPNWGKKRVELAEKLIERGHEVSVITIDSAGKFLDDTYKGIHVVRVPQIYNPPHIFYPVPNFALLAKTLYSINVPFDVLHFFKQEYPSSLSALLNMNKPKVLSIDNFPGLDYKHGVFFIDFASFIYSMTIGKLLLTKFDRFISLCKISVRTAMKLGVKKDRIHWIPHGIDTRKIKPDSERGKIVRQKMRLKGPIFSFIGRLSPVKGLVYLSTAAKQLDRSGVKGNLLIVGDGTERNRLLTLKKNENMKVHFLGYQKNAIDFIQASDFIVLPSLSEGCPNVVLEALACGKPVIASRVGGVPDLIHHMETGVLVDPKDVTQLVEAIYAMISDPYKAKIMGREARKFAERELDWDIIAGKYEKIYRDAVN